MSKRDSDFGPRLCYQEQDLFPPLSVTGGGQRRGPGGPVVVVVGGGPGQGATLLHMRVMLCTVLTTLVDVLCTYLNLLNIYCFLLSMKDI